MGGKSSKDGSWRQTSSVRSTASSSSSNTWGGLYQYPFDQESQTYAPQQSYTQQYSAPAQDYGSQNYGVGAEDFDLRRRLDRRYSRIADNFNSLEQVLILSPSLGKDMVVYFLHLITLPLETVVCCMGW